MRFSTTGGLSLRRKRKPSEWLRILRALATDLCFFVEIGGRPVAICIALLNLDEVIRDFNGKLNPMNVVKLWWRLKVHRPKSFRCILLGIRQELRREERYRPLAMAICAELMRRSLEMGYEWADLGWTLEDNQPSEHHYSQSGWANLQAVPAVREGDR